MTPARACRCEAVAVAGGREAGRTLIDTARPDGVQLVMVNGRASNRTGSQARMEGTICIGGGKEL